MINHIIKFRWVIIIAGIVAGIGFGILIPFSRTDPEIRNYIPQGMSSRISTDKIENEFGVQDMILILFTDSTILTSYNLQNIKDIDRDISRLTGISNRISPFTMKTIKGEAGMMIADPLIKKIPENSDEIESLRKSILENSFVKDVVFSADMTSAAITATISSSEPETSTLHKVDSIISLHPSKTQILKGGLPYIRKHILLDVRSDAYYLIPGALFIMLLILKLTLGDWRSVFIPFTVVILSTSISMGLIPLTGWKFSIITLLVPVIIVAVANNYGIYLVARHQEISPGWNGTKESMLAYLTGSLNMPILFSGLTTIAGILGLLTHSIIPAKQVGLLAATGVTLALLMSLTFVPALIYFRNPYQQRRRSKGSSSIIFNRFIESLTLLITRHPAKILVVSLVTTVLLSFGIFFLKIDTNQENFFPPKNPIRTAAKIINGKFGGSQTISIMVDGDIKDPSVMKGIDNMTNEAGRILGVGKVFSISQAVREMTKAIYSKEEKGYDNIPESKEAIAQLFELYNMSGDASDFKQLLNPDNTKAHILLRLSDPSNNVIKNVQFQLDKLTKNIPAKTTIGGYAVIMSDFAESVIRGQVSSLVFAVITVFLLLAIIFRSLKGGITGSIPLVISIFILFGFMGITGIALDAATALLSSIMIGVGVDFTIQYMWCFNTQLRKSQSFEDATVVALKTIGRSIIINALNVMAGFSVLMFSGFTSIRFFGYLVAISIGSCLAGALIIIPAFLIVFKPDFISQDINNRKPRKNEKGNNNISVDTAAVACNSTDT
jgi:uncharacterized protein